MLVAGTINSPNILSSLKSVNRVKSIMAYAPPRQQNRPSTVQPTNRRVLTPEQWHEVQRMQEFKQVIPKREGRSWSGLLLRPKHVSFATQNHGEQIFILLRRHWSTNLGWIINEIFYSLIPVLLYLGADLIGFNLIESLSGKLFVVMLLIYYSFIFTNSIRHLYDWYYNVYIVTNERVIDYDFIPFASRAVAETVLTSVQDVKEKSIGFLPSLFNYGEVSIYSAADRNVITFEAVPNPTFVRDKIADLAKIAMQ